MKTDVEGEAERARFAKASELSRYFGGTPRVGITREDNAPTISQIRRHGC